MSYEACGGLKMNLLMLDSHDDDPERMREVDLGVILERESVQDNISD